MKPEKKEIHIPFCHKCCDVVFAHHIGYKTLAGCNKLSQKDWDDGMYSDDGGPAYQHNCPLMEQFNKQQEQEEEVTDEQVS